MRASVYGNLWARLAVGAVLAGLLSAPGIALGQSLKEQIVGDELTGMNPTTASGGASYTKFVRVK